jgi:RimJ/RimL family protein N-acetyltransferase
MNNSILSTPRLILRNFAIEDAQSMFELNADPQVIRYTGDEPFASVEAALSFILNYDRYTQYGYGRWTVIHSQTLEYLGWCGLNYNEDNKETDLGFRFMKKWWGKGYATEAAKECLSFGFNQLGLKKIIGRALIENNASIRVLTKLGMKFEKEFEAHGSIAQQYFIETK